MKLSIITVNKNNASGLEKTIQSVINQTYNNFEYIIIDGNSTDSSVEVIKKYDEKINFWVSETDTGIYNAMNKGIRKAQGEFCLFLNSGDWLISPTTLSNVLDELSSYIPSDIYYSDKTQTNGTVINLPDFLTVNFMIGATINHQNSLIKRSLFNEHGFYNENLSIASDWEFFLKEIWKYKSKFTHLKTNISIFDTDGIGSQPSKKRLEEDMIIHKNIFGDLSAITIEMYHYHRSVYWDIIKNFGASKFLIFCLRSYRFIIKKTLKIKKFIFRH